MTVWIFSTLYPPYTGGAASDAELLIRGLLASGSVDRVVLVTEYHKSRFLRRRAGCTILGILPRRDSLGGGRKRRGVLRFALAHALILALLVGLGLFSRRAIVHMHGRLVYRWTAFLVRALRLRAVVDVKDLFGDPRLYARFPMAMGVSLRIVALLARHMPTARIRYIPVPLDRGELAAPAPDERAQTSDGGNFLFVGTMSESKGVRELVEAYLDLLRRRGTNVGDLILVGANRLEAPLDTGGCTKIRLLGSIPRNAVYALMRRANRIVLPSRSEGLPRVCIEAMALGVPVVCPPGIIEFDNYCPECVLPDLSPATIATMMERDAQSLVARRYPLAQHDIANIVATTVDVYRRLRSA
jgi:glycosyltransferase involved in cell wall biosynthesis